MMMGGGAITIVEGGWAGGRGMWKEEGLGNDVGGGGAGGMMWKEEGLGE